jgi:hypothetical protein
MTATLPRRFRTGASPRWLAVVAAELTLRLRDTNVPILLACMAAVCMLLTPAAGAGYAVITFGGVAPDMSATTAVFAAGIVLSLLAFPIYALGLGVGCARDRHLRTGAFIASSPVNQISVLAGRILANLLLLFVFSLAMLSLVIAVTAPRLKSFPDVTAITAYLLVVIPSGFCGVLAGACMDRWLGDRIGARAMVIMTVWCVLMVCSVVAGPDAFGLRLLKDNAPRGIAGSEFAVGIVVAQQMARVRWVNLALTPSFFSACLRVVAVIIAGFVPVLVWPRFLEQLSRATQRTNGGASDPVSAVVDLPSIRPRPAGALAVSIVIAQRWFQRGGWIRIIFAAALASAILTPRVPRVSLSLTLLVPLAIANAGRLSGESYLRQLELSTASMWRPSPLLFTSLALTAAGVMPVLPALAALPLFRIIHIVVALLGMVLWLTWTCAGLARPLLGISMYVVIWYFESFGDMPAAADFLGFTATSTASFSLALVFAVSLCITLLKKDTYAFRSSRYV